MLRYIEHTTCLIINCAEGPPPVFGEVVETVDMVSGDRIVGTVVEVYNGTDVRLDVTDGTVTGDDEDEDEDEDEPFDNTQAISEGWMVNKRSCDPPFAIEKLDDPADHPGSNGRTFLCDQLAYVHVMVMADEGSAYHRSALDYLKKHSPEAYRWVVGGES